MVSRKTITSILDEVVPLLHQLHSHHESIIAHMSMQNLTFVCKIYMPSSAILQHCLDLKYLHHSQQRHCRCLSALSRRFSNHLELRILLGENGFSRCNDSDSAGTSSSFPYGMQLRWTKIAKNSLFNAIRLYSCIKTRYRGTAP